MSLSLVLAGASGFIGTALCNALLQQGHALTLFTRAAPGGANTGRKRWLQWTPGTLKGWDTHLDGADGVINLAGEPIARKRWTLAQRRRLERSRIDATQGLVQACAKAKQRPRFLINASAVGYYGPCGDRIVTEETPPGDDFLAGLCRRWEEQARKAEDLGLRVVRLRIGMVLGYGSPALAKMALPLRFFVGGRLGSGRQWISWIHLEDLVRLVLHCINDPNVKGALNATAPNPVRNEEFGRTLAKMMGRPCWTPVPGAVLKLALGEMAQTLLTGQRVVPAAADKLGFEFRYSELNQALEASRPFCRS